MCSNKIPYAAKRENPHSQPNETSRRRCRRALEFSVAKESTGRSPSIKHAPLRPPRPVAHCFLSRNKLQSKIQEGSNATR
ncbi:hypothetical protein I3842_15G094700 [Carya illinoinensis]|uniref:Uncharacterized protein n=1 Tax=Carya illinoinensis TaxID=32201 RepID=A0A922AEP4_CARIL|nr:hypothetical protein I3842_15G094700 [Carya illinoinensis]